ncbi:DNA-binding protein [Rhizobacter sp. LjRoot28]|uniref:DNA-binding protein n=1 Tax=Rhizobacter sp. LjRoot28 TaxID=3342309 RepID=UPI003ED0C008
MGRGITQTDVWQAADALLLEGARPTIERVRQKIGSGSPNTVSPHLETWFKHLGARIKDPGAFAVPSGVPDPVLAVAKHLWDAAQAEARRDVEQLVTERMAVAVANVEAEKERAAQADRAAFAAVAQANRQSAVLEERANELEAERLAHARTQTSLASSSHEAQALRHQLAELTHKLEAERTQSLAAVEKAQERAAGAERRAALHIEAERTARNQAEQRATISARRVEQLQAEVEQRSVSHLDAVSTHVNEVAVLRAELTHWRSGHASLYAQFQAQSAELNTARAQVHAAAAQAELADKVISAVRARKTSVEVASRPKRSRLD